MAGASGGNKGRSTAGTAGGSTTGNSMNNIQGVTVLKIAHHGGAGSTDEQLLSRLNPSLAIISVGTGNIYGHPDRKTIEKLKRAGAEICRTDRDGAITVDVSDSQIRVSRYKAAGP